MAYPTNIDRQFRPILDASADGVLVEARDRVVYVNDAYAHFLGYRTSRELTGATIRDIALPEDYDLLSFFSRCREQGKPAPFHYAFRARRRDGGVAAFDASVWVTHAGGDVLITTMVREVVAPVSTNHPGCPPGLKRLSGREQEVFTLLLAGRRSKEIALLLNISEKTVGTLRSRIYVKLALRSDLDLFRFAARHGLLDLEQPTA